MYITFLIPPVLPGKKAAERSAGCTNVVYPMPNIYELIVAAMVEQMGHIVRYRDFVMEKSGQKEFLDFLENDDSKIYFFWTVNLSLESDAVAAQKLRQVNRNALVVFLGPGATYFPEKLLLDERCIIVRGEPENTVLELVTAVNEDSNWRSLDGITWLKADSPERNSSRPLIRDLDQLPFPARHLIKKYQYFNPKLKRRPYTTVLTSRNCPYKCIYCVPSSLTFAREIDYKVEKDKKPPVSFRSVENIVAEIDQLAAEGYKAIAFIDDNFIVSEKRLQPVCYALKKHDIVWGCQARADAITENIAKMMGESGCRFVDLGVESFNDEILKYIRKGLTVEQIYRGIEWLKKYSVPVKLNILIGTSPMETPKTIKETVDEARKLDVSQVMINIVAPFPGTEFYSLARKNGWILGGDYVPTDVQHESILNYPNLSNKQMTRILRHSNMRFFLRPSIVWQHVRQFRSLSDFVAALKAFKIKLFG
jgi:anaerobic magnesium-protoporphyrin IX monomethyl ester cyclase